MKSSKAPKIFVGIMGVIFSAIFIGCTVLVPLTKYNPELTGDYSLYKGKRVYLMNFENQANDTTIWSYSSPDKKFRYSNDNTLQNYFWYAFRDAFTKLGMLVSQVDNPDLTVPAMWVTLLSITDENYEVKVTVQKRGITVFSKKYTIREPSVAKKEHSAPVLEQRAYRMTNKLLSKILEDPAFKKHLAEP
jgi:hypothetical protein